MRFALPETKNTGWLRAVALLSGPLLGLVVYAFLPDVHHGPDGAIRLGFSGRLSGGLAVWMAIWWLTEALPLHLTALLPLAVLPVSGAGGVKETVSAYFHPLIFLFLCGFLLALAMERWGLHRRFALATLGATGGGPRRVVGGFMLVTALLSMWVSNTATTMMMLPIATSVLALAGSEGEDSLSCCLLLGIAYGASIGGLGTLIGTPPNLFLASYAGERLGIDISFVGWLAVGLPIVALFLPLAWWLLTRVLHPVGDVQVRGSDDTFRAQHKALGPMSRGEWATLIVFLATAGAWVTRPLLRQVEIGGARPLAALTDTHIALAAAALLFLIPVNLGRREFVMNWRTALRTPWQILLLFGGGLSLAGALDANNVGLYLGSLVSSLGASPGFVIVLVSVTMVIFLTELTSNTATASALVPVFAGIAPGFGMEPLRLCIPVVLAASCAFMMPVATPPNAIVFGSGRLTIRQMARTGLWMNLIGIGIISILGWFL